MRPFFNQVGTIWQHSRLHTLHQNEIVERKYSHLLQVTCALRFQAGLPFKFWGENVLTTTYLINRVPTLVLSGKTAHEMLYNILPFYTYLPVF